MSVSITLPCGCQLNAAFVIGMCATHAYELRQSEIENQKAHEKYECQLRLLPEATEP